MPDYAVRRELADYALADTLVVLSRHCEQSFLEYGYPTGKLFRNPVGVNLEMFAPTAAPPPEPPTVIYTGTWSLRKGCDLLTAAWRKLPGVRLVHVGPVADCPLPNDAGFQHYDAVDQLRLRQFYAQAHVFATASREDGFSYVIPQALACGLRVVCTTRTGGSDLKEYLPGFTSIRVICPDDLPSLVDALQKALAEARTETGLRDQIGTGRDALSWAAYGRRYNKALKERL